MGINRRNVLTVVFLLLSVSVMLGCLPQRKMTRTPTVVPDRFKDELRKIGEPRRRGGSAFTRYKVKRGDTVWKIAKEFGVTPDEIVRLNQIPDVTDIKIGRSLRVPSSTSATNHVGSGYSSSSSSSSSSSYRGGEQGVAPAPRLVNVSGGVSRNGFVWPLVLRNGLQSRYGERTAGSRSTGIELNATAREDVLAVKDGTVVTVYDNADDWGKTVVIRHQQNTHTWYAYNSMVFVRKGMQVKRGQIIAKAGKSGRAVSPRLHFKVFVNDKPVNPLDYLPR